MPERNQQPYGWPASTEPLIGLQSQLGEGRLQPWRPSAGEKSIGGVFVCFEVEPGPGSAGDRAWSAAVVTERGRVVTSASAEGVAGAPYQPGLLAFRAGALLEAAVQALPRLPDVLLVNATGRDHPRRVGLSARSTARGSTSRCARTATHAPGRHSRAKTCRPHQSTVGSVDRRPRHDVACRGSDQGDSPRRSAGARTVRVDCSGAGLSCGPPSGLGSRTPSYVRLRVMSLSSPVSTTS